MAEDAARKFNEGDKVFAWHHEMLYPAIVKRFKDTHDPTQADDHKFQYFIHYQGWKSRWDEWVLQDHLLPHNEETIALQREVKEKAKALSASNKGSRAKQGAKKKRSNKKGRKRGAEAGSDDDKLSRTEVKIQLPNDLKRRLVTDWEWITRGHQLVELPRPTTADDIFDEYISSKVRRAENESIAREVVEGLRIYFNEALEKVLLYRFEQRQYETEVRRAGGSAAFKASRVYGLEHLLRMFVKLPSLIAYTQMEHEQVSILQKHLQEFLRFLNHKLPDFAQEYKEAPPEYLQAIAPESAAAQSALDEQKHQHQNGQQDGGKEDDQEEEEEEEEEMKQGQTQKQQEAVVGMDTE